MKGPRALEKLRDLFRSHPIVTVVGPRQCGKITLALELARTGARRWGPITYFDLEDSRDLARLDNPRLALEGFGDLVIIDEVQRRPELFPTLRVLVVEHREGAGFWSWGAPRASCSGRAPSRSPGGPRFSC